MTAGIERIGFEDPRLQRMEQATLWLQRMRESADDERIVEEWLDWCQRDPLNQQAFDDISAVWEISGQLPREPRAEVKRSAGAGIMRRALVASLLGLAVAGGGAWWWSTTDGTMLTSGFSSPVGANTVQKLADGSVLTLGGGTRVTVSIGRRERRVDLHEGQLFVSVRHDASRPFAVVSGRLEVVATGTAFDVLRSPARTTVTVTEGSVAAFNEGRDAETNVRLQSGQQLIYSHALHSLDVRQVDAEKAVAWRSGMLTFQLEPMAEVIATVNRYAASGVVLAEDPRLTAFPYSGTMDTRNVEGWIKGMPGVFTGFDVRMTKLEDGRRLVAPVRDARAD